MSDAVAARSWAEGGRRPLGLLALTYGIFHHSGVLFARFGELPGTGAVASTRWADWLDLLTPFLVLLPAGWALARARADRKACVVFAVGVVTYVEGHGVHLAANSVGNVEPNPVAHLWDEVVGHSLLHVGVALVFSALIATFAARSCLRRHGVVPVLLALAVGLTHATNALEGGTAIFGLVVAGGFVLWGCRTWRGNGHLLVYAYGPALAVILGYGLRHGGFPQPSSLASG